MTHDAELIRRVLGEFGPPQRGAISSYRHMLNFAQPVIGGAHELWPAKRGGKNPEQFARWRAPAGGMVVRGTTYVGGKLVPEEAAGKLVKPKTRRLSQLLREIGSLKRFRRSTWDESKHPRGKPENKGEFTEKPVGKTGIIDRQKAVHRAAIVRAKAKIAANPKPTVEAAEAAGKRMDAVGADRYEADIRGNTKDRAASRKRLLAEFGDGATCPCVYCGLNLVDEDGPNLVTRDKIYTARQGGRYTHGNLLPACLACNKSRSDTPIEEVKWRV